MHELLNDYPVVVELPVAWAEMDLFGHVNNTVFFRWFESARIAYLERIGFDEPRKNGGIGPILASTQARFRRPVTYPDAVLAGARTVETAEDRFTMEYRVVSSRQEARVAEGAGVVVAYDYDALRKAALPGPVRDAIATVEEGQRRSGGAR